MIILHRIASALLFIPISLIFILIISIKIIFNILNNFHYENFYEFPVKSIDGMEHNTTIIFELLQRILGALISPFIVFFNDLKGVFEYKF